MNITCILSRFQSCVSFWNGEYMGEQVQIEGVNLVVSNPGA